MNAVRRLRAVQSAAPADAFEFNQWAARKGWSDGLPVLPPTTDRVEAMVKASGLAPDHLVAAIAPRLGAATVEKLAVNAVMAGCEPQYMPLLIAALQAVTDPELNLDGIQTTTNAGGPMFIVNGPARQRLGIACGADALGVGNPVNQTIGRAIRLVLRNIGGAIPPVDRSTLGAPWKMVMVLGENEEISPWPALHTTLGFKAEDSVVTTFNVESVINVPAVYTSADAILHSLARAMQGGLNVCFSDGALGVALSGGHARILAEAGMSREDIQNTLFERTKIPLADLPKEGNIITGTWTVENGRVLITRSPKDILVFVAGDESPYHSCYFCGWGLSRSASRRFDS